MKQTKPYGRAHWTAAERTAMAMESVAPPAPLHEPTQDTQPSATPDLFSLKAPPAAHRTAPVRSNRLRASLAYVSLAFAALGTFVLVRDSLLLAQILQQMSSPEAVMVCKDGRMHYASHNPLDLLLGRGHFICTEWSVRRSLLSIPRPYY